MSDEVRPAFIIDVRFAIETGDPEQARALAVTAASGLGLTGTELGKIR